MICNELIHIIGSLVDYKGLSFQAGRIKLECNSCLSFGLFGRKDSLRCYFLTVHQERFTCFRVIECSLESITLSGSHSLVGNRVIDRYLIIRIGVLNTSLLVYRAGLELGDIEKLAFRIRNFMRTNKLTVNSQSLINDTLGAGKVSGIKFEYHVYLSAGVLRRECCLCRDSVTVFIKDRLLCILVHKLASQHILFTRLQAAVGHCIRDRGVLVRIDQVFHISSRAGAKLRVKSHLRLIL